MTDREWKSCIEARGAACLKSTYGSDGEVLERRCRLLHRTLDAFAERFGDRPVRVFRSPGRINLRGMHVDTHGGYLNLMTHQREVVVAASPDGGGAAICANIDPRHAEVAIDLDAARGHPALRGDWTTFIMHPEIRARVEARRGDWANYIEGCFLSVQHRFPDRALRGMNLIVGSDLPRGAALSSSAALCVSVVLAAAGCNGLELDRDPLILAARDAEWYTGSRCGLCDQAAMVIGGLGEVASLAIYPPALDTSFARRFPFPGDLRILVVNSYTERSLSGAALVEYTRNRFAYSLAMEILRQEMRARGLPADLAARMDRLSNVTPAVFAEYGGAARILELLASVPERLALAELRERYDLPEFDRAYQQYFGTAPAALRPKEIGLRGPLMFGIAESERARLFAEALVSDDAVRAGALMTAGHDGDRRKRGIEDYVYDVSDAALEGLRAAKTPVEMCPGAYGASTPVLDYLVDAALEAGALGASLTGAGMAGSVLALCRAENADAVGEHVRRKMAAPEYAALSARKEPLSSEQLDEAVVINTATAPAGELTIS